MMIYCSHGQKVHTKASNYFMCRVCLAGWYSKDPVPLVVIGFTDEHDVIEYNTFKRKYSNVRCEACKDVVVTEHAWCNFKLNIKKKWKRLWQKKVTPSI